MVLGKSLKKVLQEDIETIMSPAIIIPLTVFRMQKVFTVNVMLNLIWLSHTVSWVDTWYRYFERWLRLRKLSTEV